MIQKLPSQEAIEDLLEENARNFIEGFTGIEQFLLSRTDKYPTSSIDAEEEGMEDRFGCCSEQVLSSDYLIETSSERDILSRMDQAKVQSVQFKSMNHRV